MAALEYSSKADAAKAIGIAPRTVYGWPEEVDVVIDMLLERSQDRAVDMLSSGLTKAVMVKLAGMDSDDERVRQDAATEIIDRIMGKARQGLEISGKDGEPIEIDGTTATHRALDTLAAALSAFLPGADNDDQAALEAAEHPAVVGDV